LTGAALLLVAALAAADDPFTGSAAFARVPAGVRAPALGGLSAAVETGPVAALANPAGLAQLEAPVVVATDGGFMGLGRTAALAGIAGWATPELPLAVTVFRQGLGDDIEFRRANTAAPASLEAATATVLAAGLGLRCFPALDLGFGLRYLREEVGEVKASGFTGDLAVQYRPWTRIASTIVIRDLAGSSFDWNTGGSDRLPASYVFAGAVDLNPVLVTGGVDGAGSGYARWRFGAEWDVHPALTARLGLDAGRPALGLGFRTVWRGQLALAFDYSFAQDQLGGTTFAHRFGLTASWLDPAWKTGRLIFPTEEPAPRTGIPEWMTPSRRPPPLFTWPDLGLPTGFGTRPRPRRPAPRPLPPAVPPSATPLEPAPAPSATVRS